jgi:hypothetical protein
MSLLLKKPASNCAAGSTVVAAPAGRNVERYLLVTTRTPGEVLPGEKLFSSQGRPPINFLAVLDNPGSMQGGKIEQARTTIESLHAYAELLGNERAEQEAKGIAERVLDMRTRSASAKQTVAAAFSAMRGSKDLGK